MKITAIVIIFFAIAGGIFFLAANDKTSRETNPVISKTGTPKEDAKTAPPQKQPLPAEKILETDYHVFQTRNNCASAALSMALSYFGIRETQKAIADETRPYNDYSRGDDDKSTSFDELAAYGEKRGLIAYYRPNGRVEILRQFIANGIPVIAKTLLHSNEDFGHYRVVKGYDDNKKQIIEDDGYEGKNIRFSYDKFMGLWQEYNYEYLIFVRPENREIAEDILGEEKDAAVAWRNAVRTAEEDLNLDPEDVRARFNLATASYYTGDYDRAAREFERIEKSVPLLKLWYQMEPVETYYAMGSYDRVLSLSSSILKNNISYAELYLLRGKSYLKQGDRESAKKEFEKAVYYNKNLKNTAETLVR